MSDSAVNGAPPCEVHVPGRDAPSPWCAACRMSGASADNDPCHVIDSGGDVWIEVAPDGYLLAEDMADGFTDPAEAVTLDWIETVYGIDGTEHPAGCCR